MTAISPPATPDRDKKEIALKIMRNPDEDRKIENYVPGGLNVLLPGKLYKEVVEVVARGSRSHTFGERVDIRAVSNRKFNNIPQKDDSQL